ncbi:MAG: hypothetical protein ACPGYV_12425, partial [Phycisphaeraceae bacterium]
LRPGEQRKLLDEYAGIGAEVAKLAELFRIFKAARGRLEKNTDPARLAGGLNVSITNHDDPGTTTYPTTIRSRPRPITPPRRRADAL